MPISCVRGSVVERSPVGIRGLFEESVRTGSRRPVRRQGGLIVQSPHFGAPDHVEVYLWVRRSVHAPLCCSVMTTILDDQLYSHSDRLAGRVVLITGGGAGIGREAALQCAKFKAKLVLGDINEAAAKSVAGEVQRAGGEAIGLRCGVTSWEDQVHLFQTAFDTFGSVDVVVANAGVNEIGNYFTPKIKDGKLEKPTMSTVDVNLLATIYTTHLAIHFLELERKPEDALKSIVLLGSMASWQAVSQGPMYSAAKSGVLALARALAYPLSQKRIRVAIITPFFTDTALVGIENRVLIAGVPLVPIERVGGAIILAATDRNMSSTGAVWLIPDSGPLLRLGKDVIRGGVYDIITDRARRYGTKVSRLKVAADLWAVFWSQVSLGVVPAAMVGSLLYATSRL